jgi:Coenzyme PQQ synthesis protein D (PqqD)
MPGSVVRKRRRTRINEHLAPAHAHALHTVEVDGEAVLLDERSGRLHLLNPSAALVWACFDGVSSIGEIVDDISDELGAPRDVVLAGTLSVSRQLADEGLLANVDPARRKSDDSGTVETSIELSDGRFVSEPPNT